MSSIEDILNMLIRQKAQALSKYLYSLTWGQITGPTVLAVELTNNCNANCIMCGHGGVSRKKMHMDYELFQKIILDAKENGIKIIQLSFYGEPLMYSRLTEAVRYIKKEILDATIVINTNASLLSQSLSKELLDAGLSLFSISIDGSTKEDFEKIRVGLLWDQVRQNVKDLRELIDTHKYPALVHIRGLNLSEYPANRDHYINTWKPFADKVYLRKDHYLTSLETESVIHKLFPCDKIFSQMIFMADGRATICAYDWEGEMSYGDFQSKNIKQLWKTRSSVKLRILHFLGLKKSIYFCRKCMYRAF